MLETERFHELLISAGDIVRVSVGIEFLKIGSNALVSILDSLPVLSILLSDPGWQCLANSPDPSQVRLLHEDCNGKQLTFEG